MLTPFFDFQDRFQLFHPFERLSQLGRLAVARDEVSTPVFFRDTGESFELSVDLPGVREKDLDITLEGDVLTLRAEAGREAPQGYEKVRRERPQLRFHRQLELPARVDANAVRASFDDGVLTITLPKALEARPRKIPVLGAAS